MADMAKVERITITIDKELLAWVDKKVEQKVFSNRSHALEFLAYDRMKKVVKESI